MESFVNDQDIQKKRWYLLLIVGLATALSSFALNAVTIALPLMSKDYNVSGISIAWVQTGFILTSTCLVVVLGRVGDSFGKMRQFKLSLIVLIIGLLLGTIKGSFELLITARVIQGIGSAMSMSVNFAIATELFPRHERGRALGVIGAFLAGGGIVGPAFSGIILQNWGYHAIFLVGVPIAILTAVLAFIWLPKDRLLSGKGIDYTGSALFAAVIVCFFFGVNTVQTVGLFTVESLLLIAFFVVCLVLFTVLEKRASNPLIKFSLIKEHSMLIYLLSLFLIYSTSAFNAFIMPFYLLQALHISPGLAALMTVTLSLAITIVSPMAGRLTDKYGAKNMILSGTAIVAASQLAYIFYGLETNTLILILTFVVTGIGSGIFQVPNNAMIMSQVPKEQLGLASSLAVLTRNLALTSGSLFASVILFTAMSALSGHHIVSYLPGNPALFIAGMHTVYFVTFALCALAFVLVLIDKLRSVRKVACGEQVE
ncbi:MAG: MFS transporter [Sporolactobacillus sp.]